MSRFPKREQRLFCGRGRFYAIRKAMNIDLVVVGRTAETYLQEGIDLYARRIGRYVNFRVVVVPELRNAQRLDARQRKEKEGEALRQRLEGYDQVVLLDERGKTFASVDFAAWLEHKTVLGLKRMAFVIGGAYGFSDEIYRLATERISLSELTLSHQLVRLVFVEQLYRAFTILNHEPYHHP